MAEGKRPAAHGLLAARLKAAKRLKIMQKTVEHSTNKHIKLPNHPSVPSNGADDADSGDEDTQQVTAGSNGKPMTSNMIYMTRTGAGVQAGALSGAAAYSSLLGALSSGTAAPDPAPVRAGPATAAANARMNGVVRRRAGSSCMHCTRQLLHALQPHHVLRPHP